MSSKFLRNLQIGFAISFILVLLSSGAAFIAIKRLVANQNQVEHTLKTLRGLEDVVSTLKDSETGQRGYLITGDERFLQPYYRSQQALPVQLNEVKTLILENPAQQKNWNDLNSVISKRSALLKSVINQKKANKEISLNQMLSGKKMMDSCRLIVDRMKEVERKLLVTRTAEANKSASYTPLLLIFSAILSLIITIVFYLRIRSDFKSREALKNQLLAKERDTASSIRSIEEIALKISAGDYSTRIHNDALGELSKLSVSLNAMAASLEDSFNKLNDDEWLQKGIALINEKLVGNKTVDVVCHESLEHLVSYGMCQNGAVYLYQEGKLMLNKAHGLEGFMKPSFKEGEGLIGQVFKDGELKLIQNLEDEDYHISFSGGSIKLRHLLFIPIVHDKITVGVVELGCNAPFAEIDLKFHQACCNTLGAAITSAKSRRHIQNLLEETQAQTEELQAQHNEMENINAELEAQTQKLQASEEELKVQQEELLESNQQLEERSKDLEEKNQLVVERNMEIQQKAEEIALSTKYKSEFLANMSHELRTPLNSILLLSRLTAENPEGNLTAEQIESAKVIQSSGNGLLALIDEILDLSKIEAGKMDVNFERIEIQSIIEELKGLFKPLASQKNIELQFDITKSKGLIETDFVRLGQILKNLLSNAIKFTAEGGVTLNVTDKEDQILFKVTDTGIGISKDKQKLIFEAFQQEDGSTRRKFGGTGLGLSISRELAKLLGGKIEVDSEPGKGSSFLVSLPKFKQILLPEEEIHLEDTPILVPEKDLHHPLISKVIPEAIPDDRNNIRKDDKVILIVEDDTIFAKTLLNYARKENYKGVIVVRGDLALPAAIEYQPRAILLDIQLPIMDGWMVMEHLKSNMKTRHIPVHIMSSLQAKKESLLKGAVDFINKPFAIEEMGLVFKKIEDALNRYPKKVLIVEENTKHATALAYFLSNFNINSEIKNNVSDSTAALKEQGVDCVILDMGVPYENAYETLDVIRQNPGLEHLPIIIFTGKNISKVEELKIKRYADSIIVKTAHSYQRILDEVGLFLHLVEDDRSAPKENKLKKLGVLSEVIKNKTVLIADDDVRNIFSLSKSLEKHQMNVVSAIDGKEALYKLDVTPNIDVILMDIMMPEMDGYETIKAIRKNPKYKKLPIIAVTAKAMMGDREKCIQVGASDYISKPVDIDQLLSLLRVWLYQG